MPLTSDITINAAKFDPASNSEQSRQLNDTIEQKFDAAAAWYKVCTNPSILNQEIKNILIRTHARLEQKNTARCDGQGKLHSHHQSCFPKLSTSPFRLESKAGISPVDLCFLKRGRRMRKGRELRAL